MRARRRVLLSLFCLWCFSAEAAFDLSPIIASVTPSGPGATTSFTITNADDTRTPVQISLFHRIPDENGNEKYEETKDIGDMFQIFPSQVILNPKEKRAIRVTYVGDPKLAREMAFRIIAEEFPINVSDPNRVKNRAVASIAIASKYVGSLYVTPPGTKPDLSVEAVPVQSKKGNDMVITMENKGTQHFMLKNPKIKLLAGGKEYPMPAESVSQIGSQNILAGKVRKYTIPWPNGVPVGAMKVSVELPPQQ